MKTHMQRRYLSWLMAISLTFLPALAHAIVTVLDPGGKPVTNKTVTITLPGQQPKEAETDDDGILFWLDGSKVDELPPGTTLGDRYTFVNKSGMTTMQKVGIGAGVVGGIAAIALLADDDDDDNDGGSTPMEPQEPMQPEPPEPPAQPGPAMLNVTPDAVSDSRQVGGDCPFTIGEIEVSNSSASGSDSLDWSGSVDNANLSLNPTSGSVAAGGSQTVLAHYLCSPDNAGTVSGTASFDAGSAGTDMVNVSVTSNDAPASPGELTNTGPADFVLVHTVGVSDCPDEYGSITIQNTGGTEVDWSLADLPSFVEVRPGDSTSGTLLPGDSVNILIRFPCSGFMMGSNLGDVLISGAGVDDVSIPISLTVQNP